ncbi:Uncharacterized protein dnm_022900 [Desulfonema magnum]|uniref:Uncharacterized protein n=1 Tax=Desulfonema magnum TaxID=45655 RepID=A0A975BIF1_9BACT|nr:Uncharacterized protein dnm_022900 [Desulfonema magnum]
MSQKKQNNLIRRLCGGLNKRFAGRSCNNYERSTTQCRLLRKHRMNEFWEKCRGEPFTMMYDTVTKITNTFRLKKMSADHSRSHFLQTFAKFFSRGLQFARFFPCSRFAGAGFTGLPRLSAFSLSARSSRLANGVSVRLRNSLTSRNPGTPPRPAL